MLRTQRLDRTPRDPAAELHAQADFLQLQAAELFAEATRLTDEAKRLRKAAGLAPPATGPKPNCQPLTRRQREVARLIARGRTNRQIADTLFITEGTAANHVRQILQRLDLRCRAEIAAWAVANQLVAIETAKS